MFTECHELLYYFTKYYLEKFHDYCLTIIEQYFKYSQTCLKWLLYIVNHSVQRAASSGQRIYIKHCTEN